MYLDKIRFSGYKLLPTALSCRENLKLEQLCDRFKGWEAMNINKLSNTFSLTSLDGFKCFICVMMLSILGTVVC